MPAWCRAFYSRPCVPEVSSQRSCVWGGGAAEHIKTRVNANFSSAIYFHYTSLCPDKIKIKVKNHTLMRMNCYIYHITITALMIGVHFYITFVHTEVRVRKERNWNNWLISWTFRWAHSTVKLSNLGHAVVAGWCLANSGRTPFHSAVLKLIFLPRECIH